MPFVRPGGDILLKIEGWPKVSQVLAAIDATEAAGVDPCDAAPDHWRHVANRIAADQGAGIAEHAGDRGGPSRCGVERGRSEEHTSELQSLMRNSYAVFCL